MKALICAIAVWVVAGASSVQSQTQVVVEGYTFLKGITGSQVCLGTWVPPTDVGLPGVCEGQLIDIAQLTAISSRLSADRLDQVVATLSSIDQKLSVNNDQIKLLLQTSANTEILIDQQTMQVSKLLRQKITEMFDALPEEILNNESFKQVITKLREDILKEIEKRYPAKPTPAK
jgi:hypothetical protein